jgi:hypothetical protein
MREMQGVKREMRLIDFPEKFVAVGESVFLQSSLSSPKERQYWSKSAPEVRDLSPS